MGRNRILAEQLEQNVSAQREAQCASASLRVSTLQQLQHEASVTRLSRVVKVLLPVRLSTTTSEVEAHRPDSVTQELSAHVSDITPLGRTLHAMEDEDDRRPIDWLGRPVEIQEVSVRGLDPLAAVLGPLRGTHRPCHERLSVRPG
jgi:hypothetical protein